MSAKEQYPGAPQPNDLEEKYRIKAGRIYFLLGGEKEDLITSCDTCGAPYYGETQGACLNCKKSRKVFWADVTDSTLINNIGKEKINNAVSLKLPGDDVVEIQRNSYVEEAISSRIVLGQVCKSNFLAGNEIYSGHYNRFGTVIVADGGTGQFGFENKIKLLVVGRNAKITFEGRGSVEQLLRMGPMNLTAGNDYNQGNSRLVDFWGVSKLIANSLQT